MEDPGERPRLKSTTSVVSELEWTQVLLGKYRKRMHSVLEDPSSSRLAHHYNSASALFVLLSLLILIIGSMREFQVKYGNVWEPHPVLQFVEYMCIAWFTKEFLLRFLITPHKCNFIHEGQNIVDLLSIFPFYVELLLIFAGISSEDIKDFKGALLALRLLRIMRVARLLRLARHSGSMQSLGTTLKGALLALRLLRIMRVARLLRLARHSGSMQSLGTTLKSSWKEVCMLALFLSTGIVLYSTVIYFLEKDIPGTTFTSIPASFWWCVTTMTTVGYGDMVPKTAMGKVVASLTSISGVIVLGFPIAIIVENFDKVYKAGQQEETRKAEESARSLQRAAAATPMA